MPSMVFGVFLRAIYTFKTLNCAVAYGLWGDFWHLGGGHGPLAPPKSAYGVQLYTNAVLHKSAVLIFLSKFVQFYSVKCAVVMLYWC